jgi:hypothetical protein
VSRIGLKPRGDVLFFEMGVSRGDKEAGKTRLAKSGGNTVKGGRVLGAG